MMDPSLSVVVVSINTLALLRACLEALAAQADSTVEVIVVRDSDTRGTFDPADRQRFPFVRWVDAPSAATVPQMRALGVRSSRGAVIALIEDDCEVAEGWCRNTLDAHRGPEVAVGGPVDPGPYTRLRDWAVYFCEYGRFMSPLPPTARLAGTNVSYKRAAIVEVLKAGQDLNDVFLHWTWASESRPMRGDDRLIVRNINAWRPEHLTVVPYHHGRAFAARRFAHVRGWRRWALAGGTAFLPGLQLARMIATVLRRQRHVGNFVKAIPGIVLFSASWSAGEMAGCLFGDAGSASRWR
jgi:hypothetical protein